MTTKGVEGGGGVVDNWGGAGKMLVVPAGVLCTVPCGMLSLGAESSMGSYPRGKLW